MRLHKKFYSPFLVIFYSLTLMLVGLAITNIALFIISYYLAVTSVILFNKKRNKKFLPKRLFAEYWQQESGMKEIIEIDNVDISRRYLDVSPIPRHQTTYHTHPNPKFER